MIVATLRGMDLVQRLVPDELWELFQRVVDTYLYFHGVVDGDWGMSTAAGLMKGVIGFVLIYLANKVAHRLGEQGVYR